MQNEITEAESITGRRQKNNKNKAITKNRDQPIHSNINIKEEIKKTASKGCRQWRRWWSGSPTPRIESSGAWTTPEKTEPTPAAAGLASRWEAMAGESERLRVRVRGGGWEWQGSGWPEKKKKKKETIERAGAPCCGNRPAVLPPIFPGNLCAFELGFDNEWCVGSKIRHARFFVDICRRSIWSSLIDGRKRKINFFFS